VETHAEDWRNREKRGAYLDALKDMVEMTDKPTRTGTHSLRQQAYSRVAVLETLIERWVHDWSGAASRHRSHEVATISASTSRGLRGAWSTRRKWRAQ